MTDTKKPKRDSSVIAMCGFWGGALVKMAFDETKSNIAAEAAETVAHIRADEKLGVNGQVRDKGRSYVATEGKTELKERQFFTNAALVTEQQNVVALRNREHDVNGSMVLMGALGAVSLYAAAHEAFAHSALAATVKAAPRKWLAYTAQFDRDIS